MAAGIASALSGMPYVTSFRRLMAISQRFGSAISRSSRGSEPRRRPTGCTLY